MITVVISGPESTGKSTLTNILATEFNGLAVPEYARDYVMRLDKDYTEKDVETIARRQVRIYKRLQFEHNNSNIPVFFDTFLIITKIWFQEVYGYCPVWLHESIRMNKPDLVLLCYPDLEWKDDGVRENPTRREYLNNCYAESLEYYSIPWFEVKGHGNERTMLAMDLVNNLLKTR